MPYNSSSFEKQLAKHKIEQAQKSVAAMPRTFDDPHKVKAHISAERGSIKPAAKDPLQLMGEGAQTTPVITARDQDITPIIIAPRKKPFYKRAWFIFMVVTTLPVLFAPILYKEQIAEVKEVAGTLKDQTGVDPFALKTYTNMLTGRSSNPAEPQEDGFMLPSGNTTETPAVTEHAEPMDMKNAVEKAQEKTESITSQGAGYSMKYIEEETKRLNDAAKKFDEQYKK